MFTVAFKITTPEGGLEVIEFNVRAIAKAWAIWEAQLRLPENAKVLAVLVNKG